MVSFLQTQISGISSVAVHTSRMQFLFQLFNVDIFGPNFEFLFQTFFNKDAWDVISGRWVDSNEKDKEESGG